MADVNPTQAKWARESAGLTLAEAAKKLMVGDSKDISAADKLSEMETGQRAVTEAMLNRMARIYRWPLIAFYLKKHPSKEAKVIDFRTLSDDSNPTQGPLIDALVTNILGRHGLLKSALEDEETAHSSLVGLFAGSTNKQEIVQFLRENLDDESTPQQYKHRNDFDRLRERIHNLGVFVLLQGNLGTYHTEMYSDEFRGFAIADSVAPCIVLNKRVLRDARTFTLIHEFVHILLGNTGLSGDIGGTGAEQFCNDVASEFLVPERELAALRAERLTQLSDLYTFINVALNHFCASSALILYKTYRSNIISSKEYAEHRDGLSRHVRDRLIKVRTAGARGLVPTKRYNLGSPLLSAVKRALSRGSLSFTKAAYVLDIKPFRLTALLKH